MERLSRDNFPLQMKKDTDALGASAPAGLAPLDHPSQGASQSTSRTGTTAHQMKPLASDFSPSSDDVICGRGKKCYNHIGNERFRRRVMTMLDEYSKAKSKLDKSGVLSRVMSDVRRASPGGGFVKQDESGRWFEVGDFLAREKTSQAFRDALHERYKSSNISKKKRRQQEQAKGSDKAQRIAHSEKEISSRLERITNDLMGPATAQSSPNPLNVFNQANIDMVSPFSLQSGVRFGAPRSHMMQQRHQPDPLFGPRVRYRRVEPTRTPMVPFSSGNALTYREVNLPQRANSLPDHNASASLLSVAGGFIEDESLHSSLPNIHFNEPGAQFPRPGSDNLDYELAGLNHSLPNMSYSQQPHVDAEPNRAIDPFPYSHATHQELYPRPIGPSGRIEPYRLTRFPSGRKEPPESDLKKSASWPKIASSPQDSSDSSNKDLLSCLEKLTDHSISDGNPFEPIPLAASAKPPPGPPPHDHSPAMSAPTPFRYRSLYDDNGEFAEG